MEVAAVQFVGSRNLFLRAVRLAALSAVLGTSALAQSTASLSGAVSGASGAVVVNAKVVATKQGTGGESATQTDTAGACLFLSLPIGMFCVLVTTAGFQSA